MKKILCFILTVILMLTTSTLSFAQTPVDQSGSCGDNILWNYKAANKTLTFSGSGTITEDMQSSWIAVRGCTDHIIIDSGITAIGGGAFGNAPMKTLTVNSGVKSIGENAFFHCYNLEIATIADTVTRIEERAFSCCELLRTIDISGPVTDMGREVFLECTSLETVNLADSVESIPNGMFDGCTSLKSIDLPDNLKTIGRLAFVDCESLENVTFPEKMDSIGYAAFTRCKALGSISLPEGITVLEERLFAGCTALESVDLPDSLTEIKEHPFRDCTSLKSIVIPKNIKMLSNTFLNCVSLESVTLPDGMTDIGGNVFSHCSLLKNITIPQSVTHIYGNAFYGCESLESIVLPSGLERLGDGVFGECTSLNTIVFPEGFTDLSRSQMCDTPYFKTALTKGAVYINNVLIAVPPELFGSFEVRPDTVIIRGGAFSNCKKLTEVIIPEGITAIESFCFSNCVSLERIVLPHSLELIKQAAFLDCTALKNVHYMGLRIDFPGITVEFRNDPFKKAERTYDDDLLYSSKVFSDVSGVKWYASYIDYVYTYGILKGVSEREFEPNSVVTRAMFVTVLARLSGDKTDDSKKTHFTDVGTGKWYSGAVKWASENGVVNGVSKTEFGGDEPVTREQICTMLVRFAQYKGITLEDVKQTTMYYDKNAISKWAYDAVIACYKAEIFEGSFDLDGNLELRPRDKATRAEVSKIISVFHHDYMSE